MSRWSNFRKNFFWKWSLGPALQSAKKIFRYEKILSTFFTKENSKKSKVPNQLALTWNLISTKINRSERTRIPPLHFHLFVLENSNPKYLKFFFEKCRCRPFSKFTFFWTRFYGPYWYQIGFRFPGDSSLVLCEPL